MANSNQQPFAVLPLAPIDYDVQHLNSMVRLLNNNFNTIKNPGHSRAYDLTITNSPTSPVDTNTGQVLADGTVWNDGGFLKILPEGNPGTLKAGTATVNLMYADTAFITDLNVTNVAAGSVTASTLYGASITGGYVDVAGAYYVNSTQVVAAQQPPIPDAAGPTAVTTGTADLTTGIITASTSVDASSLVGTVNQILIILRNHGLIAT